MMFVVIMVIFLTMLFRFVSYALTWQRSLFIFILLVILVYQSSVITCVPPTFTIVLWTTSWALTIVNIIINHILYIDIASLGWEPSSRLSSPRSSSFLASVNIISLSTFFQSFKLFISVSKVFIFWFITAFIIWNFSHLLETIRTLSQAFLKELNRWIFCQVNLMVLGQTLRYIRSFLSIIDHFLFEVE